jgi:hypothetical protein
MPPTGQLIKAPDARDRGDVDDDATVAPFHLFERVLAGVERAFRYRSTVRCQRPAPVGPAPALVMSVSSTPNACTATSTALHGLLVEVRHHNRGALVRARPADAGRAADHQRYPPH